MKTGEGIPMMVVRFMRPSQALGSGIRRCLGRDSGVLAIAGHKWGGGGWGNGLTHTRRGIGPWPSAPGIAPWPSKSPNNASSVGCRHSPFLRPAGGGEKPPKDRKIMTTDSSFPHETAYKYRTWVGKDEKGNNLGQAAVSQWVGLACGLWKKILSGFAWGCARACVCVCLSVCIARPWIPAEPWVHDELRRGPPREPLLRSGLSRLCRVHRLRRPVPSFLLRPLAGAPGRGPGFLTNPRQKNSKTK